MVHLVDPTVQQVDATLSCPLIDLGCFGNLSRIQFQLPQGDHQQPFCGPQFAVLEDRVRPVIESGKLLAQTHGAIEAVVTLQAVAATLALFDDAASTTRTYHSVGPTQLPQVISGFVIILQVRYSVIPLPSTASLP